VQKALTNFIYGAIATYGHYHAAACGGGGSRQLGGVAGAFGGAQHIVALGFGAKMTRQQFRKLGPATSARHGIKNKTGTRHTARRPLRATIQTRQDNKKRPA
jgi:hypothetical protein